MKKEKLFEAAKDLPDDFEPEDLFEHRVLVKRIEEGIRQSEGGETLSEAEARKYLGRWLPQSGAAVSS